MIAARISVLILLTLFTLFSSAQEITSTKLNLHTKRTLQSDDWKWDDINLFVKGDKAAITALTERNGGLYKYGYGDISAVTIPVKNLDAFLADPAVVGVENGDIPVKPLNDTAAIINGVTQIHDGAAPLSMPYTGQGVVVAIVDDGIDIDHEDFQLPNGETRIRFLWDMQGGNINIPTPYGYGREWTEIEINNGTCTHNEAVNTFSHGSHVAGTAAGNGRATGKFKGMAPEADLVVVRYDLGRPFLSSIVDAMDYCFKKADAMGRPCVINASLGTYVGSRDGDDYASQLIGALLEERSGRAVVAAAGNAGQHKYHLGYQVTQDTSFTWFKFNPSAGDIFFQLYADTADFNNVDFSFGAVDPNTWNDQGRLDFLNVQVDYAGLQAAGGSLIKNYTLNNGVNFIGGISTQLTLEGDRYLYEAIISPNNTAFYWSFITTGSGKFDIWSSKNLMNFSDMVYSNLPDTSVYDKIRYYKAPDTMLTIVSSFNSSEKVLTVGNYSGRYAYVSVNGDTVKSPFPQGEIFVDNNPIRENTLGSSYGPTRDGRLKPDISAPGTYVISTANARYVSDALGSGNINNIHKIAEGGRHFRNTGTSMASPMVAGAVALYLQKNPDANWREILDAFTMSAFRDTHTGPDSNNAFGYGKLNAFAAMQMELNYGCTDPDALNYDATANMDDGSCIAVLLGCTDVFAINYDSLANLDDGTCQYDTLPDNVQEIYSQVRAGIYPNPSAGSFRFYYEFGNAPAEQAQLVIINLLGQVVHQTSLNGQKGYMDFDGFQPGAYIYKLKAGSHIARENKFIVQ